MSKRLKEGEQYPRSLVVAAKPHATVSEQFRTIRTNIMFSGVKRDIKSVLFTSDMAGAGKSTVASNMAVAYAQTGKKTLLIDGDLRRPTCHQIFNVTNHTGLSNAIASDAGPGELVKSTEIDMLHVLTSGPIPPNPAELLSAPKLKQLMETFEAQYDIIIIDSPPLLSVTDAQLLSQIASGVILVTNTEKNNRDRLNDARDLLLASGANIIGMVLNKRIKEYKEDDYHYYYQSSEGG